MKVYKEKQFLIFDFENGKKVKYDFATNRTIGFSGKYVKDIKSQLRGWSMDEILNCCEDKRYARFLEYVYNKERYINVGTVLSKVNHYSFLEQYFSAGFKRVSDAYAFRRYNILITGVPKSMIKVAQTRDLIADVHFIKFWKDNPDGYFMAYNMEFNALNDYDIYHILTSYGYSGYYDTRESYFNLLIRNYGYNAKSLLLYLDNLKLLEAIEDMRDIMTEIYDYARMMADLSNKFDRYPRHFLSTHRIATRSYERFKTYFNEELFKKRITPKYEMNIGDYTFIYPKTTQDIKEESVQQHNCVSSYIDRVINNECHILFLRLRDNPQKSLVTLEVVNDKIVQAKRHYNDPVLPCEKQVIEKWEQKIQNKRSKEKIAC